MVRTPTRLAPLLLLLSVPSLAIAAEKIYDPTRDASKDLLAAEQQAAAQHKNILLDVGGNWCPWCVLLDRTWLSNKKLHKRLDQSYVLLHVNMSQENENRAFLGQFPEVPGYPHLFVLSPDGKLLLSQDTSALEFDHKIDGGYNDSKLQQLLDGNAPAH